MYIAEEQQKILELHHLGDVRIHLHFCLVVFDRCSEDVSHFIEECIRWIPAW